jgi:hypothetical protein
MSRRKSGGVWANTNQAAEWLNEHRGRIRAFAFHLRMEGKLPDAWDYDVTETPRTALDQQWIFDNWEAWSEVWTHWRERAADR